MGTYISIELLKNIAVMESEEELLALAMEQCGEGNDLMEVKCYQRAAELGSAVAQYQLGQSYEVGIGVTKSEKQAVHFYKKAAVQHHADAMSVLANYYRHGLIVEQNDAMAKALLILSIGSEYTSEKLQEWYNLDITTITETMIEDAQQQIQILIETTTNSDT